MAFPSKEESTLAGTSSLVLEEALVNEHDRICKSVATCFADERMENLVSFFFPKMEARPIDAYGFYLEFIQQKPKAYIIKLETTTYNT
jgi:hypothetical protein